MEGFLHQEFEGLLFGGAYFRNFTACHFNISFLSQFLTIKFRGGGGGDLYGLASRLNFWRSRLGD